jgi:DNA-binding MarR family transcriptional regulator/GNAT superfamily N-acetyltransferase
MQPAVREKTDRIAAVRRFNRFYTQRIGVLRSGWLDSSFTLTEARVLYEIKQRDRATATEIGRDLGLDPGYLSRLLRAFHKRGLIHKQGSPDDGRQTLLSMTAAGRRAFAPLEARTRQQVATMLGHIPAPEQDRLVSAMATIETLLDGQPAAKPNIVLREPRAGDFGTIVTRHAVLYAHEYGWTENFEGLCTQIVADFVNKFDPARERCWIAEIDGRFAGSVMLVRDSEHVARLRLLLVEPFARGLGIGTRLTDESVRFAKVCGYRKITLWTHGVLTAARHIYERAGFKLVASEKKRSWGQAVVSEHWDLTLT